MIRRFGRPGLIGTMARTAVIAGTATAVTGAVAGSQQRRAQAAQAEQQAEAQQAAQQVWDQQQAQQAPPPPPAAAPAQDELMSQLAQLGQMHQSGVLSDAEFGAAKAKLLGI